MKTGAEGFHQCCNAQVGRGDELRERPSQLLRMKEGVAEACGETPNQVLADAGYCNERDLRKLEERGIDGYVAAVRAEWAPRVPDALTSGGSIVPD